MTPRLKLILIHCHLRRGRCLLLLTLGYAVGTLCGLRLSSFLYVIHFLLLERLQQQRLCFHHESHCFRDFLKHHYHSINVLVKPYASSICSIFPLCTESNALGKSANSSVALSFFAPIHSMICRIVRIFVAVKRFLGKPFRFFLRIFSISGRIWLKSRAL